MNDFFERIHYMILLVGKLLRKSIYYFRERKSILNES